jgi:hypothetical protein
MHIVFKYYQQNNNWLIISYIYIGVLIYIIIIIVSYVQKYFFSRNTLNNIEYIKLLENYKLKNV